MPIDCRMFVMNKHHPGYIYRVEEIIEDAGCAEVIPVYDMQFNSVPEAQQAQLRTHARIESLIPLTSEIGASIANQWTMFADRLRFTNAIEECLEVQAMIAKEKRAVIDAAA